MYIFSIYISPNIRTADKKKKIRVANLAHWCDNLFRFFIFSLLFCFNIMKFISWAFFSSSFFQSMIKGRTLYSVIFMFLWLYLFFINIQYDVICATYQQLLELLRFLSSVILIKYGISHGNESLLAEKKEE